ncbi:MAG: DUF2723 domain-containing protein [bacterium]
MSPSTGVTVDKKTYWKSSFFITFVSLAFYVYTLAPDALWNDSPIFQLRIYLSDYVGALGLALSHPLYILIGRLFSLLPFHNPAYTANLISAIFGALTIGSLFLLLRLWEVNWPGAILACLTLMVSHTFWTNSVIAEVYTLYTFLFLAEMILLTRFLKTGQKKYLFWLFWVNGLNLSNHLMALLSMIVYFSYSAILLRGRKITGRDFLILCSLTVLGALPYEVLIAREYFQTRSFFLTLKSALIGSNAWKNDVFNTHIFCWRNFKNLILFLGINFPVFHIFFVVPGAGNFWKERNWHYRLLFTGIFLIYFIFAFRYTVADQYVFYLPVYIFVAMLTGLGIDRVSRMSNKGWSRSILVMLFLSAISPVFIFQKIPALLEKYKVNIGVKREIPYRNSYQYFLNPSKRNYYGARKYALHVFEQAEEGSVIFPDYTIINTLLYFQNVEAIGKELFIAGLPSVQGDFPACIEVTSVNILYIMKGHKLYLTSDHPDYSPEWILKKFRIKRQGILYQVLPSQ